MRYIFLAIILSGVLILGMFGLRGHKFNETPVEIFPDMDRQDRINAQSRSDFFADGVGSRKPVNGTVPIGFSVPEDAAASPSDSSVGSVSGADKPSGGAV